MKRLHLPTAAPARPGRLPLRGLLVFAALLALACRTAGEVLGFAEPPPPTASNGERSPVTLPTAEPQPASPNDLRILTFQPVDSEMEVRFTLLPGEESFLFSAVANDDWAEVAILQVTNPQGDILYEEDVDSDLPLGGWFTDFLYDYGEVSLFLPVAPQMPLPPGEYAVLVWTEAPGFADLRVTFKRGPADVPQALDFNIWLATGELGVFGADDQTEIRAEIDAILNPHGLQVGAFTFNEPHTAIVAEFATLENDETYLDEWDVPAACRVMAREAGAGRVINLILVDWIIADDADPGDIVGYSSGLPGSILNPDAGFTCVVASYQAYLDSNLEHGLTWIHEAAHFMGLLHTTEEDGLYFDNLADTPECPASRFDRDRDGYVDDYECGVEGGANNFIFYSGILDFAPFVMSPDQAWVLRRHPLFYPVAP